SLASLATSSAPIIAVAVSRRRFEQTRNTSPRVLRPHPPAEKRRRFCPRSLRTIPLLMRRANVTAVDTHRNRTIGQRLSFPLLFRALELIELALLAQLLLDAFCRQLQVVSDGLRIHQITDRQHFLQQIRRSCKRDQGCPLRLQIPANEGLPELVIEH